MTKQVIWTNTAKKARREILQYWIHWDNRRNPEDLHKNLEL